MTLKITKEISLNDDFTVFEILNHEEETYDYYLWKPSFPMVFTYGVPLTHRMSRSSIVCQYENGYFDNLIDMEFV